MGIMSLSRRMDYEPMSKKKLNELERLKQENAKLRRQNLKLTVENAYIKNWMPWFKKEPTKTEIAQAITELRHELGLAVKKIIEIINTNEDLPHISRSNYYDAYTRDDKDQVNHGDVIARIQEIYDEIKNRYVAPGYRRITHILHREGYQINRKTVNRLMHKMDLYGYVMKRRHP